MKLYRWIPLALLCALLAGVAWASPAQDAAIDRDVIGSGGARRVQGSVSLETTLGQPVAGVVDASLCVGFQCPLVAVEYNVYIPVTLREHTR
jgi:hypothetical protein